MSVLQETVSRLRECVEEAQANSRQGTRDTAAAQHSLRELRLELASTQASHRESMELMAEQSGEAAGLRSELSRLQQRSSQLSEERGGQEERTRQLAAELHRLRTASRQSLDETRSCEGRLAELSAQLGRSQRWGQEQLVALEEEVEMASLRENYHVKVAQVDALHSQCDSMEHKYSTAANEMEVLRQSLGNARSDSSLLHRESELVVTNVNQWVKEQKQGNEKLNFKIKDQSKMIIHLTAEKDHLQKSVEGLQEEMKRLKAELEESRIEAEKFRASQASMSDQRQRSALARLPVQLLHTDGETLPAPDQEESSRETQQFREQSQYQSRDGDKLAAGDLFSSVPICSDCERSFEWSGRQPVEEENSGCQSASALAPDAACACLAGRGATFAAEVARRVALRALERRPLPCGHHRWSRPALSAGTGHALHISGRDTGGC
nr:polyamine-modulated factor 1-binding protein 1 isoform X1 [Salvelinus alpinus]